MKATDILPSLISRRDLLRRQWAAIDNDPEAQRFAPVRSVRRFASTEQWIAEFREHVRSVIQRDLPELRRQRAEAEATARLALERGLLGRIPRPNPLQPAENSYASEERLAQASAWSGMMDQLERMTVEVARSNAWQRWRTAPTEELAARIEDARDSARAGTFEWSRWYADREALRTVLAARAAEGDQRAAMYAGRAAELEDQLIASHVPGSTQSFDYLERTVAQLRHLADSIQATPVGELLGPVDELLGDLDALERQAAVATGDPTKVRTVLEAQGGGLEGYSGAGSASGTGTGGAQ